MCKRILSSNFDIATKFQIFHEIAPNISQKLIFKSIIEKIKSTCFYPINCMAVICEESILSFWAVVSPLVHFIVLILFLFCFVLFCFVFVFLGCGNNDWGAECTIFCSRVRPSETCERNYFCVPDPVGCSCIAGFSGEYCTTGKIKTYENSTIACLCPFTTSANPKS